MMKRRRLLVVELDITNLDEEIEPKDIKSIDITYFNEGEGTDWTEQVPFKVLSLTDEIKFE